MKSFLKKIELIQKRSFFYQCQTLNFSIQSIIFQANKLHGIFVQFKLCCLKCYMTMFNVTIRKQNVTFTYKSHKMKKNSGNYIILLNFILDNNELLKARFFSI